MKKKTNRKTKRVSEFKFESSSTPGKFYTVTVEGESYNCTCPGFAYRKKCSHLEKAKNQKQIEPADEEEMAKDTPSLFPIIDPIIEIEEDDWDAAGALSLADNIADESCRAAEKKGSEGRWRAIEALGELGDNRAVKALVEALEDKEVRESAAYALDELGWDPDD